MVASRSPWVDCATPHIHEEAPYLFFRAEVYVDRADAAVLGYLPARTSEHAKVRA